MTTTTRIEDPPTPSTSAEPRRSLRRAAGMPRWARIMLLLAPAMTVVAVFFAAGVAQALAQSFGYQPFLPDWHWSAEAYRQLGSDPAVRASLLLTARVALTST